MTRYINLSSELVSAVKAHATQGGFLDGKNECTSVSVTPSACIPILVSHRAETKILFCQAFQSCVNSLLLPTYKPYLHLSLLKGIAVSVMPKS